MTFTAEVKDELAHLTPSRRCCRLAELSALFHLEGILHVLGSHRLAVHTESENAAVARKMFQYTKELFAVSPQLRVEKAPRLRGHNCYCLYLGEEERTVQILNELCLVDNSLRPVLGIPERLIRRHCCRISYLRGAFLGGGYISKPDQPAHLEINVQHVEMANDLRDLIGRFSLAFHVIKRHRMQVVYSKSRRDQVTFLALVGAHRAVLRLESDAVLREIREDVNRRVNSETANLERAVDAAQRQLRDIRLVEDHAGLEMLPAALREIAEARMRYPEASMKELGGFMHPPISKSAVYHRFLRIHHMAEKMV
jgi:DNA-binding protein WhiA